jgi:hypothetical protein
LRSWQRIGNKIMAIARDHPDGLATLGQSAHEILDATTPSPLGSQSS